jgi:hypothetical protein
LFLNFLIVSFPLCNNSPGISFYFLFFRIFVNLQFLFSFYRFSPLIFFFSVYLFICLLFFLFLLSSASPPISNFINIPLIPFSTSPIIYYFIYLHFLLSRPFFYTCQRVQKFLRTQTISKIFTTRHFTKLLSESKEICKSFCGHSVYEKIQILSVWIISTFLFDLLIVSLLDGKTVNPLIFLLSLLHEPTVFKVRTWVIRMALKIYDATFLIEIYCSTLIPNLKS